MDYDQFRTLFHEALDAAGLMPALPQPLEAVSLGRMSRTYETIVKLGAPQPRPFYVTATLGWEWGAALAARSATTEEDLLVELLGRECGLQVLHLEAGDVENELFVEKVRTVTDDNRGIR
jgi:hypothetical protein